MASTKKAFVDGGEFRGDTNTLWERIEQRCRRYPDHEALVVKHQSANSLVQLKSADSTQIEGPDSRWTYSDMENGSRLLAESFLAKGVGPGDVCALLLENTVEWALMYWAAIRAGFALVPFDSRMASRPQELSYNLQKLKPKALVVMNETSARQIDTVGANAAVKLVSGKTSADSSWSSLEQFGLASRNSKRALPRVSLDETLHVMFTSGTTTGQPKGCLVAHRSLLMGTYNYPQGLRISHQSRVFHMSANFRAAAPSLNIMVWAVGGTVVTDCRRFDADIAIENLISERCTVMICVPSHLIAISEAATLPRTFPVQLECVGVAADIIDAEMIRRTKATFGDHVAMITAHGMTEGMGIIGWKQEHEHLKLPTTEGGILSIGHVLSGAKVRIVDSQTGEDVLREQKGELHVSSPAFVTGYMDGVNAEDFYADEHGQWFKTGDVGVIDEREFVYIIGRSKDIIKFKGGSLSPAVLEGVLNIDDDVFVKVVGVPSFDFGTIPVAVVKCSPKKRDGLKEMLIERSVRELGIDYGLHQVYSLEDLGLEEFPLNATGKVQRIDLAERIQKLKTDHDEF